MKEEKDDGEFVLHLDNFPSRNSSMNRSSRLYYRITATEGVPFQWEMQPGTPKNPPPTETLLPPISPPPALLSLGLPKQARARNNNKLSLFVLFGGPWRKQQPSELSCRPSDQFGDGRSRFGSCGSHCELLKESFKPKSSASTSTSTSCSSSSSSSLPLSASPAKSSDQWQLGCGPWRIKPIKISIGRRV